MSTIRYFDATIDGWRRITVVEIEDGYEGDAELSGYTNEIRASDLPGDFANWQQYDAGAGLHHAARTLSADGT